MLTKRDREKFERLTMKHLDAAYNLALWIMKNPTEAEDVVQTAYLKAFENFLRFDETNVGGWILTIVRNSAFNLLKKRKLHSNLVSFDEAAHSDNSNKTTQLNDYHLTPDELLCLNSIDNNILESINKLSPEYREILFLREIEELSYKEIAEVTNIATGTVMSRLSRARKSLRKLFLDRKKREATINNTVKKGNTRSSE